MCNFDPEASGPLGAPARNHGSCKSNLYPIQDDENNSRDFLQACVIQAMDPLFNMFQILSSWKVHWVKKVACLETLQDHATIMKTKRLKYKHLNGAYNINNSPSCVQIWRLPSVAAKLSVFSRSELTWLLHYQTKRWVKPFRRIGNTFLNTVASTTRAVIFFWINFEMLCYPQSSNKLFAIVVAIHLRNQK